MQGKNMIVKEIRVLENVNVPFLANMLEELKKLGCEINEENERNTQ